MKLAFGFLQEKRRVGGETHGLMGDVSVRESRWMDLI